jgi:hypothetical protein
MACIAPAKLDLSKVDTGHSHTRWGETDKSLGVFFIFPAISIVAAFFPGGKDASPPHRLLKPGRLPLFAGNRLFWRFERGNTTY